MKYLVVGAHNNEDTAWTEQFKEDGWEVMIDTDYRPIARESHAYLKWIVAHYDEDFERCILCQGHPFDQGPNILEAMTNPEIEYLGWTETCDKFGEPRCHDTPMHSWADVLGMGLPKKEKYEFVCGTQYQIKPWHIQRQPLELWVALYNLAQLDGSRISWVLERLFPDLFGMKLTLEK